MDNVHGMGVNVVYAMAMGAIPERGETTMGATTFGTISEGKTVDEAFRRAQQQARHEYGHRGYTGSIAEKSSGFRVVTLNVPANATDRDVIDAADAYLCGDACPNWLNDKWGEAGAVRLPKAKGSRSRAERWYFFGWASC